MSSAVAQRPPLPQPPAPIPHAAYPTGSATALGETVAALLADPAVSRAHWGIAVTTLDGQPVYGFDEGQLFRPASNNKIFTTAAAMALLGPDKTFTTRITGKLDASTGTVSGDLTLMGGGDANFAADDLPYVPSAKRTKDAAKPPPLADLASLADQLVAKGVKRVTGDIVGDDTLFSYEPYAESWAADDQIWGYGAPVSALSIDNNELKLTVTPGQPSVVKLDQFVPYYKVESEVRSVAAGEHAEGIQVERLAGSRIVRVYGSMAADARPDVEELAIADPAEYAAMALRAMLELRGIVVTGSARARHRPLFHANGYVSELLKSPTQCTATIVAGGVCLANCAVATYVPPVEALASRTSAPLAEDVVLTNKVSQNLHAEVFLHNLGLRSPCTEGSTVEGASLIRAFLVHAGLDPDDFLFFDGSGLSDHDLVTPRATATFLAFAVNQPWFPAWKASLPEGGEDGSLDVRFPGSPLKDHLFAKTGTLGESRGLSGYLDAASGRPLIFSIFVDTHTPSTPDDRIVMDKIVTAIAANN